MSEEKEQLKKIEVLPNDAIITIEVNGAFYANMYQLMLARAEQKPAEEFAKILEHLRTGAAPRDVYERELALYLGIIYEIEKSAKDQGKLILADASDLKLISNPFRV